MAKTLNLREIERISVADPVSFERDYLATRTPVVLRDLAAGWPALSEWTPTSLAERFGAMQVPVYDASFASPGGSYMSSIDRMPFREFLEAIFEGERDLRMFLFNIASQVPDLADDVRLPDLPLRFSRRFLFTFFGCRGAVT
ncbi:MAG: cupin-like domain-containing protein, partial [Gammaproteobacteria bacterium]|nr:cupin-like domain-containing protein [Gammaproteobacteria bacterium]